MKARLNIKLRFPLILCVSALGHVALFWLVSVRVPGALESSVAKKPPERFFSLVNIKVDDPPAPLLLQEQKTPPVAETTIPLETTVPLEAIIPSETTGPAETFIPVDELPVIREAVVRSEAGGSGQNTGTSASAAAAAEYVRRNYSYIQRLISGKLVYPSAARKSGIQGVTEVSFTIYENGTISGVTIRTGSGYAVLDEAAAAAVNAAVPFPKPPAAARIAIPISFKLK